MPLTTNVRDALIRTGAFTIRVVPSAEWLAIRSQQHQSLPWHDSVLRPLLDAADTAWAYEMKEDAEVFRVAAPILRRERGKYAIDLSSEAIRGHELFWNASGGQRGSVVLSMPLARFPARAVLPHCQSAFVVGNSTVPHTPSAVRLARSLVSTGRTLCCLLSRTNGFEWISLYAAPEPLEALFQEAQSLVTSNQAHAPSAA
jgi:hypothetical protein